MPQDVVLKQLAEMVSWVSNCPKRRTSLGNFLVGTYEQVLLGEGITDVTRQQDSHESVLLWLLLTFRFFNAVMARFVREARHNPALDAALKKIKVLTQSHVQCLCCNNETVQPLEEVFYLTLHEPRFTPSYKVILFFACAYHVSSRDGSFTSLPILHFMYSCTAETRNLPYYCVCQTYLSS